MEMERTYEGITKVIFLMEVEEGTTKVVKNNNVSVSIEKDPREEVRIFEIGDSLYIGKQDSSEESDVSLSITVPKGTEIKHT